MSTESYYMNDIKKSIEKLFPDIKPNNLPLDELIEIIIQREKRAKRIGYHMNKKSTKILLETPFGSDLDFDLMDYIVKTPGFRIYDKHKQEIDEENYEEKDMKSFLIKSWIESHLRYLLFLKKKDPERFDYKSLDIILELIEQYKLELNPVMKERIIPKLLDKDMEMDDKNNINVYIYDLDNLFSEWSNSNNKTGNKVI